MVRVARFVLEAAWIMEMELVLAQLTNCCLKWQGSCSVRSASRSVVVVQAAKMLVMGVLPHLPTIPIPKSVVVLKGCAWQSASDARMKEVVRSVRKGICGMERSANSTVPPQPTRVEPNENHVLRIRTQWLWRLCGGAEPFHLPTSPIPARQFLCQQLWVGLLP